MSDALDRGSGIPRGPLFYRQDGVLMFQFGIDASNALGPRKATKADKQAHRQAFQTFEESDVITDDSAASVPTRIAADPDQRGQFDRPERRPVGRPRKRTG